jgi:hypothetical protein
MKKLLTIAIALFTTFAGFAQTSFLYEQTPLGNKLVGKSETNSVTGYTSYYNMNDYGMWEAKGVSVPNSFGQSGSTLYSYDNLGRSNVTSFSTPNYGGGTTIYSKNNLGDFSPSTIISPDYGGTYSIYSRNELGNMTPSGYYNPSTGIGQISLTSTFENSSVNFGSSNFSSSVSLPSLPSISSLPSASSLPGISSLPDISSIGSNYGY